MRPWTPYIYENILLDSPRIDKDCFKREALYDIVFHAKGLVSLLLSVGKTHSTA
jgi:hypothetical protein